VDFPPDSGEYRRASGEIMTGPPRRSRTQAINAKVALAASNANIVPLDQLLRRRCGSGGASAKTSQVELADALSRLTFRQKFKVSEPTA
jgi:hypothetical protein